jgi:putative oligomerization/nucleic acid binding protein
MPDPASPADVALVDYEYIQSSGAHGHHAVGVFDAFVGSQREIWIGSDGSGLIRETSGPASFFTEEGRGRWEAAGSPKLTHGPSIDLFAPGCLPGARASRARVSGHPGGLEAGLSARRSPTLHTVQELLGEAVVEPEFCRAVYEIARRMPDVEAIDRLSDQLGRAGHGLARTEHAHRVELIFSPDTSQLLAYQHFLAEPQPFAPAGTLHSWSAFVARRIVVGLPPEIPPVPRLPCVPPGSGRGFVIRPGFHVGTGYVDDPLAQLVELRAQGVLTDAEYESAKANALRR